MTALSRRWPAALATVCLGGACLLSGLTGLSQAATPKQTAPAPVVLKGSGAWSLNPEIGDWASALAGAPSPVDVPYIARGSHDGRGAFIRGEADFAVSGVPFTTEEERQLTDAGRSYVRVPIMPTALVFLVRSPLDGFRERVGTPEAGTFVPYDGPIRMPHTTVARTILAVANTWDDQELKDALGRALGPYSQPMAPVVRSDPSATNYQLEKYLGTVAPDLWSQKLAESRQPPGFLSEFWPILTLPSRAGASPVIQAIAGDTQPGGDAATQGGNIGPVPPWAVKEAQRQFAKVDLRAAELRNGAGEWVAPSPKAITTALEAGEGRSLTALTSQDKGAYPLAWVDELIAPRTGLTPEKTNALATLIRYAVTGGQSASAAHGDAVLPEPLVRRALEGADAIVTGNCAGPGLTVARSTDPGPYAPAGGALEAVGTMLHCEQPPAPQPTSSPSAPPSSTAPPPSSPNSTTTGSTGRGSGGGPGVPPSAPSVPSSATGLLGKASSALASLTFAALPGIAPEAPDAQPPVAAPPDPPSDPVVAIPKLPFGLPSPNASRTGILLVTLVLGALLYWRLAVTRRPLIRRR